MRRNSPRLLAVTAAMSAVCLTFFTACGTQKTAQPTTSKPSSTLTIAQVSEPSLEVGQDIPAPEGPVVLVIKNAEHANQGGDLALDLGLLDQMGSVQLDVNDRTATGKTAKFTGPLLKTVFDYAGVSGTTVSALALNDYKADLPWSDLENYPVLLATRMNDKTMSVENYGPTRVVYPTEGYDLDPAIYEPRWIWQLKEFKVR